MTTEFELTKYYFEGARQASDTQTEIKAIDVAICALDKQIPKKPIMYDYFHDEDMEDYLCCPTCKDILTDRLPAKNKDFYFHCMNCGQKFDWSE